MSAETFNISKRLCDIFDIEFCIEDAVSDQKLSIIPVEAVLSGADPWNKGKSCIGKIVGNKSCYLNGEKSRFKKGITPHNKGVPMSDGAKEHLSKTLMGRKNPKHSEWMKGRKIHTTPHTEDTKKILSEKSSMYMWITNGKDSRRVLKGGKIPREWKRGRTL